MIIYKNAEKYHKDGVNFIPETIMSANLSKGTTERIEERTQKYKDTICSEGNIFRNKNN